MRLKSKKPAKAKKQKEEIEEIDIEPTLEEKMRDVEQALASAESRIRNLNDEIDTEADKLLREKVRATYEGFSGFLVAAEARIVEKLIEFFKANPSWEYKQVSKSTIGTQFYSPVNYFPQLLAQGWRWIGQGFDEAKGERYDYFIRPKNMPVERDAILKMYENFHAAKSAAKNKVSTKAKVKISLSKKK